MDYMNCPACSSQKYQKTDIAGVRKCSNCGAVYGSCYKGESYAIVLPFFSKDPNPRAQVYFDLIVLGSDGLERRHGWYNPADQRITQVG